MSIERETSVKKKIIGECPRLSDRYCHYCGRPPVWYSNTSYSMKLAWKQQAQDEHRKAWERELERMALV